MKKQKVANEARLKVAFLLIFLSMAHMASTFLPNLSTFETHTRPLLRWYM